MCNKYKVEALSYTRSNMSAVLRNYRRVFHNLTEVVKEFKRLQKRSPENVIIVSKLINKQYVPGKMIISSNDVPSWKLTTGLYEYGWKRLDTKEPLFRITMDGSIFGIVSQKSFFEKKLTFYEIMKTGILTNEKIYNDICTKFPLLNNLLKNKIIEEINEGIDEVNKVKKSIDYKVFPVIESSIKIHSIGNRQEDNNAFV